MPAPIAKRRCRKCDKVTLVAFNIDCCPGCGAEYGNLEVGFDQEIILPDRKPARRKEVRDR